MGKLMKTRVVSEKIGVHPTTIQRWVKFFDFDWRKNEHGHYLFTDQDVALLQEIKQQLENGLTLNEIILPSRHESQEENIQQQESSMNRADIEERLAMLEASLAQKANDVVSYQVLQQRRELEEFAASLSALEKKIELLEENLATSRELSPKVAYEPGLEGLTRTSRQPLLRRVFSFFV